jgi:hypothetical protein
VFLLFGIRSAAFTYVVFCASITVRDQFLRWSAHACGSFCIDALLAGVVVCAAPERLLCHLACGGRRLADEAGELQSEIHIFPGGSRRAGRLMKRNGRTFDSSFARRTVAETPISSWATEFLTLSARIGEAVQVQAHAVRAGHRPRSRRAGMNTAGMRALRPRSAAVVASRLHLRDAHRVPRRVDDPCAPGKPDIGDAVSGLQGWSYSSTLTPRDRSQATSAGRSWTSQVAWVCVSAVPVVLFVAASWVPPPGEHEVLFTLAQDLQAQQVVVEVSDSAKVGRQQHRLDRMLSKHECPSALPAAPAGATARRLPGRA